MVKSPVQWSSIHAWRCRERVKVPCSALYFCYSLLFRDTLLCIPTHAMFILTNSAKQPAYQMQIQTIYWSHITAREQRWRFKGTTVLFSKLRAKPIWVFSKLLIWIYILSCWFRTIHTTPPLSHAQTPIEASLRCLCVLTFTTFINHFGDSHWQSKKQVCKRDSDTDTVYLPALSIHIAQQW